MTHVHETVTFIRRKVIFDAVAKLGDYVAGVIGKGTCCIARLPAAFVLQGLRQIPMVECQEGLNAGSKEFINQATVEIHSFWVRMASTRRKNPRPRYGETIRGRAEVLHQLHIILVKMIMVVCDVAVVPVPDLAGRRRVSIPNGGATTVLLHGPLDLIGGRSDTPMKTFRKPGSIRFLHF